MVSSLLPAIGKSYSKQLIVAEQCEKGYCDNATEQEFDPERKVHFHTLKLEIPIKEIPQTLVVYSDHETLQIVTMLLASLHISLPPPFLT